MSQDAKNVKIDELTESLTESLPPVNENVSTNDVDTNNGIENAPQKQDIVLKDSDGVEFNPKIHQTKADGSPSLTKLGKLKRKKGVSEVNINEIINEEKHKEQRKVASVVATSMTQQVGMFLGGESARFKVDGKTGVNEELLIMQSYRDYFEAKGISDIPPVTALCLGLTMYFGRVMTEEPAQNKTKMIWYAMKNKLAKRKEKKNARSDNRNNNVGENRASETDSKEVQGSGD